MVLALLATPAMADTVRTRQAVHSLVADYERQLVQAINTGRFDLVAPYLLPGSALHTAQRKLVARLSAKGITQRYVHHYPGILITESSSPRLGIEVHVHVEIFTPGQPQREGNHHWIYTATPRDGKLYLSNIEKANIGDYLTVDTTKAEFHYADELLEQYCIWLVNVLNGKAWPAWLDDSLHPSQAGRQHASLLADLKRRVTAGDTFSLQANETLDQDEDYESMQGYRKKRLVIAYRDASDRSQTLTLQFVAALEEHRTIHDGMPGGAATLVSIDSLEWR